MSTIKLEIGQEVDVVNYPEFESEFDVQAELYHLLRNKGIDVKGCVKAICIDDGEPHRAFLDLVIFKNRIAVAIVECKNYRKTRNRELGKRQGRRYGKFGLPILLCFTSADIAATISQITALLFLEGGL